ncbi:MAG: glycosyltransferase [Actinomycetota bacterium]
MESSATSAGSSTPVPQPASPAGSTSALPGVVATVVVGPPSPDLEVTLAGLASQDYPALQVLVLVTNDDDVSSISERVKSVVPQAHVRGVGRDVGFGVAANQVLKLVEGDGGFFLLMHDDVVLEPTAVRMLVEEMFRSNAGLAGPKLMNWDEPRVLSSVGFDVDRFGELDDGLEAHEIDQEQHDAVRDVFALSSACLLVRADLFRRLDGFESSVNFHGENLDLCWRGGGMFDWLSIGVVDDE